MSISIMWYAVADKNGQIQGWIYVEMTENVFFKKGNNAYVRFYVKNETEGGKAFCLQLFGSSANDQREERKNRFCKKMRWKKKNIRSTR